MFLGFGALLVGWREVSWPPRQGLAPLTILSTVCMMLVVFDVEPHHIATLSKGVDGCSPALGPLPPGALLTVSETWVDRLLWLRILGFVAALLIAWRISPFNRLRSAT